MLLKVQATVLAAFPASVIVKVVAESIETIVALVSEEGYAVAVAIVAVPASVAALDTALGRAIPFESANNYSQPPSCDIH